MDPMRQPRQLTLHLHTKAQVTKTTGLVMLACRFVSPSQEI